MAKKYSKKKRSGYKATIPTARIKRVVNSMAEKKFVDLTLFNGGLVGTYTVWSALAGIVQGTTASTRIGNKIRVHAIEFNVYCYPATVTADGVSARFVVYHNKETVGALTTGSMVFSADNFMALRNTTLQPRISVLRDRMCHCVITALDGATKGYGPPHSFKWTIYPNKLIDFQSNAGTISDLLKDDYGMMAAASAATEMGCDIRCKVIFSDA